MAIYYYQLTPANSHLTGYTIAKELARQCVAQFGAVRGSGVGIGNGSCCAAVAVVPAQNFPAAQPLTGFGANSQPQYGPNQLPYAVVFGNSQLAAGGLDLGPLGGHAERAALTAAGNNNLNLYLLNNTDAVLYVELTPCNACQNWLAGNGGGVPNPFHFQNINLHVWWSFPYPDGGGIQAMQTFHNSTLQNQLTTVNTW
jgi:Pyrimidine deaminase